VQFWAQFYPRLDRLANRLDSDSQAKIIAAVNGRVPIVTAEEVRAEQLEVAQAEAKFWGGLEVGHQELATGNEQVAAKASRTAAENRQAAESAGKRATQAKERVARLERGDAVAGSITKIDIDQLMRQLGITKADRRHYANVARIHELGAADEYLDAIGSDKRRRRAARKILRERDQ
jgi:hypothetical protein